MDLDHMLNGQNSRRRHQDIIRQVQYDKFARDAQAAQHTGKRRSPMRALLALVNLVVKG